VIASCRALPLLERAVSSLRQQCQSLGAEIVIARSGDDADVAAVRARFPDLTVVGIAPGAGIPRLRGLGLAASAGDPVAMTEDHCVPAADWLERLLFHTRAGADAVGGGMANAPGSGPLSWGAYLSDYGFYSYARPTDDRPVPLLTAANIAYSRRVVPEIAEWCDAGAWENVVHDRLTEQGRMLRFAPEARMYHDHRYGFGAFCRDRYEHGWDYARARLTEERGAPRWRLLLLTPLLPLVLIRRIGRAAAGEDRLGFVRALPVTFAFLCSWALGEAAGYLRGPLAAGEEAGRVAAT
jgi:hypothetical protein